MIDVSSYLTNGRKNMKWESQSHVTCQVILTKSNKHLYSHVFPPEDTLKY